MFVGHDGCRFVDARARNLLAADLAVQQQKKHVFFSSEHVIVAEHTFYCVRHDVSFPEQFLKQKSTKKQKK